MYIYTLFIFYILIIFSARLYSMLSEYRRESASSIHSDFYRFLYNRSRIKPLNKYFLTKTKDKYLKDTLSERNKIISNKDTGNKRYLYSKVKEEEMAEERKILNWLVNCDNESNNDAELDTKNKCNEKIKGDLKETIKYKNDNFKYNQFADNIVETDKHKIETEDRKQKTKEQKDKESNTANDVNSLNLKKLINQDFKEDPDISKMTKPRLLRLDDNESIKILRDCSPESYKEKSISKKSGQRKISDFFQQEIS